MDLIDTHTHLDSYHRRGELKAVLERAREKGVTRMIAVGTEVEDWGLYREMATGHGGVIDYTVGLHPCHVEEDWARQVAEIEGFWKGEGRRPVALGECGLDRFHLPKEEGEAERVIGWQKAAFEAQLALVKRLECPLVVHSRGAFGECVAMIDAAGVEWARVVLHCFSEGPKEMEALGERGGWGSFTGVLTYKSAGVVREAAQAQGLERLMLETDAPYLTPVPRRGEPNEPGYLRHTAEFAAGLFGVSLEELAERTTRTAKAFFSL